MSDEWTYFVQSVDGGPIKIGYTSQHPESRLSNLQTGSPVPLRIIGLLPGNREREMHERFKRIRKHGEWFSADKSLLAFIAAEAESVCSEYLSVSAKLKLEGKAVSVAGAAPRSVGPAWFDKVFQNDSDIYCNLIDCYEWDTIDDADRCDHEEGEPEWPECESDLIMDIAYAIEGESFIESVGINVDCGYFCFICGPCNSRTRFEFLRTLGSFADEMDSHNGHWFLFAVFWDGDKQIGVDLRRLWVNGTEDNGHLFDPSVLSKTRLLSDPT